MKIAIIGAGLSGLSCAHELERYGISPDVYEDLDFIGDREPHVTAVLEIIERPMFDVLNYFKQKCHLDIKPHNTIKKLTHNAPNIKRVVKGSNLGYFFMRGKSEQSVKQQIYRQLKHPHILFGKKPDYKELAKAYDFVVIANGCPEITKALGCWEELISGWVKGAIVQGDFNTQELILWINRKYCKNGYAYLTPVSNREASLLLFIPHVDKAGIDYYWSRFFEVENLQYGIIEEFSIEHFSGAVYPHKVDNIYLVGGAGGAISPFLGFGQVNSITMGVLAAQSMVEGLDFEKLIKRFVGKNNSLYEFRKAFNGLSNKGFHNIINFVTLPIIKQLIYYTRFNVVKYSAWALELKNKIFFELKK
ncbi:MAG: NAD(P)-binding protein [Hyphomonadaceae bacterium]|nr:NAD(P)-binding protein [Clostridia bacterium]